MKRMHKLFPCILLCVIFLLNSCNFNTADINLYGIKLSKAEANGSSAYYLSEDGTLYSSGADSDAGCYVLYQDEAKGIVAENVKQFDKMSGGGYYIDNNNDLYIWNKNVLPSCNYNKAKQHTKILENIKSAIVDTDTILYVDITDNLYLIGKFGSELYSIDQPKLLGSNVTAFDYASNLVLWTQSDGSLNNYGDTSDYEYLDLSYLRGQLGFSNVSNICITKHRLLILQDENLWCYGDYQSLISNDAVVESSMPELKLLKQNIVSVSASINTIAALDEQGAVYIWGKCISNDLNNTTSPEFEYYEAKLAAENAKSISAYDGCFCYVDIDGSSHAFYYTGWVDFYGNSTDDECVGINREPATWVK